VQRAALTATAAALVALRLATAEAALAALLQAHFLAPVA
jgi:hypothetical protein